MLMRTFAAWLLVAAAGSGSSTREVPSWVSEAGSRQLPVYEGKVPAAVVLEERHVTVDASGTMTTVTRKAVKILTREGREAARAIAPYYKNGMQVKELQAWLVAPNGFEKTFDKASVLDIGSFSEMELYNDVRYRLIKADTAEPGSVFAYQSVVQEKSLFAQDDYDFQEALPAVQSRYVLTLPAGWTASAVVFNHAPLVPLVDGSTYTWELKNLPYREREGYGPSMRGSAPRLAVDFRPVPGGPQPPNALFKSWADVARWHSALAAGQDEVTPAIAAKVAELTAGARTEYEKIHAIGRYVQRIRYVAIEMDSAHGGGFKPHAAETVFVKQYGDCKDKANLMRAMLKAAGVRSYLVAIFSGDRSYVKEEWPSLTQFNHMIVAVRLTAAAPLPAVISNAAEKILIFDPTDEHTPMGDLPWYEQGSFALLCDAEKGALLKMPVSKPEANSTDVTVEATLTADGKLSASVRDVTSGQIAREERMKHANESPEAYRARLSGVLSQRAKEVTIASLSPADSFDENKFELRLEFASQGYAQVMQQRLLVFVPSVTRPTAPAFVQNGARMEPIVLRGGVYRKQVRITLPAGFSVDELPTAVNGHADFASYSITFKKEQGQLVMEEELRTETVTLPAAQYAQVKKFFDDFHGADNQNAVLLKD